MTTEEKKCVNCGATWGQIFNNPHQCSGGELPRKRHVFPDLTATPQETGMEWEQRAIGKNIHSVYTYCFECRTWGINMPLNRICGNCNSPDTMTYYDRETIDSLIRSALAQGEKIGAEKERERINKGLRTFNFNGVLMAGKYWIRLSDIRKKMNALIDALKGEK